MMSYGGGDLSTYAEEQKKRGRNSNSRKFDPRTMKRVIQAFSPYRSEVVTILVTILLITLLGLIPSILISSLIDNAIGKGDAPLLLIYVSIMAVALLLSGIISIGQAYLSNKVGQNVMYDFRNQLYQHLQSLPLSFFAGTRTGEIQSRLSNDVSGVQGAVTETATSLFSTLSVIVGAIIAMFVVSPLLTLITLGLFPLFGWISYKVGTIRRKMGKETQQSLASLTSQMEETLSVSGILLVKVFGQQRRTQGQFQQENKTLADLTLRQLMIGRLLFVIISTFFSLMPTLVYLIAGEQIIQHVPVLGSTMTLGTMVAFTTLQFRLFFPLGQIAALQIEFQGALALFDRVFEYLDLPITIADKPDALHLTPEEVRGEVTFSNVTFTYKRDEYTVLTSSDESDVPDNGDDPLPDEDNASPTVGTGRGSSGGQAQGTAPVASPQGPTVGEPRPALNNISFTIKPGQLAALVGPSGAGKTTITYMLPRLYDVDSGAVKIDGINVQDITQASLGELIGVVTQETYLFHSSIRENLLYARHDATEEEMIAAAKASAIHERIMELEKGYDTIVGERGYKLSGGEKQRIAIARVILKNPRLLILDEATSSLDTRSERLIQTALERLMKGRTTLAIAHRLSTILAADIILVVNKGEIVERGTHQELLAQNGLYAQLYHEQFSHPSVGTGLAPVHEDPAIVRTLNRVGTPNRVGTGLAPVREERQTVPVFETQISYLQPLEATMQEKTASPTAKLPIRRASKEDLCSTTYLLPGVREIFEFASGNEQAASQPNTSPVAFVEPQTTIPSTGIEHTNKRTDWQVKQEDFPPPASFQHATIDVRPRLSPGIKPRITLQPKPPTHTSVGARTGAFGMRTGAVGTGLAPVRVHTVPAYDQSSASAYPSAYPHQRASQRVVMEVRSITKSLPLGRERVEVLKGISFQIRSGELVAIVGPSGSGKSTLLGIIAGLDNPTSGQILIDGIDIASLPEGDLAQVRNQKIGMVFQAFNLIPTLTALENVEAPLQVGNRKGPHSERAKELLTLVGLGHRLHHRPNQLSGGEQQRIAIARALATDPPIVIADEPTGNLDARNGENVLQLIADLRTQTGQTFIIATHDQNIEEYADRAIRIVDGTVAALDTTGGRITQ